MRIDVVCGSLVLLLAACTDDPAGELRATTSRVGDTVVVTSSGGVEAPFPASHGGGDRP